MKIFQSVQKNVLLMYNFGLHQNPFNWKSMLTFLVFCAGIVSNCAYFFNEAETFQEYANTICLFTAIFGGMTLLIITALKTHEIFGCLLDGEQIIDDSKFLISK